MASVASIDAATLVELLEVKFRSCKKQQLLAFADAAGIVLQSPRETCPQIARRLLSLEPDRLRPLVAQLFGDPIINYNIHKCCICNEFMARQMNDLGCSGSGGEALHWAHWACIAETGKAQCPLCRKSITVRGSLDQLHCRGTMLRWQREMPELFSD
jgi:hypothetical protein